MPVPHWDSYSLSVSLPITLAAGMLLTPSLAAMVAFVGACDLRELRAEVSVSRAFFNRSQVAASVFAASAVFHLSGVGLGRWPLVLLPTAAAVAVDFMVNTALVLFGAHLVSQLSAPEILRRVYGTQPIQVVVAYSCLGLLAVFLATAVTVSGPWGVAAFLAPLLLAREMFAGAQRLRQAARQIEMKNLALLRALDETAGERRDERLVVAGELHDEVLPPLFKVHLMGQVLRQDLNSGRLLELDDDLPELLEATEVAQSAIRSLVGSLRRSSLGPDGLNSTLRLFARQLESAGSPPIVLDLEDVGGSGTIQLLAYQVAREAMTNAAKYSKATRITVSLTSDDDGQIHLTVEDDGIGFDPGSIDGNSHFGLQLIRERAAAAAGRVFVDTLLGGGTRISAILPPDIPAVG
jgi:signal transduction histidine kinase